ncbi:MAG: hypothetical protein P8J87_03390 [Verrucomicrobiales bacterium]|nr:hypothetical protein [Verrucomicrobiales bacterium]
MREDGGEGFAGFEVPGPGFEAVVATGEEDATIVAQRGAFDPGWDGHGF